MKYIRMEDFVEHTWYFSYFHDPEFGSKLMGVFQYEPNSVKWENPFGDFYSSPVQWYVSTKDGIRSALVEDHEEADLFISRDRHHLYTFWELNNSEIRNHVIMESI